jgi:hypothetical protein
LYLRIWLELPTKYDQLSARLILCTCREVGKLPIIQNLQQTPCVPRQPIDRRNKASFHVKYLDWFYAEECVAWLPGKQANVDCDSGGHGWLHFQIHHFVSSRT